MQVNVARPMIADKIVFLIFISQFSSAQAASQETLGSARASRAGDGVLAIANFLESHVIRTAHEIFGEGAANGTRGACAPQNESLRLRDSSESMTARLCRGRTLPNIFPLNRCDCFWVSSPAPESRPRSSRWCLGS